MRDGWRKKYALEYEVKSDEKANRILSLFLSLSALLIHPIEIVLHSCERFPRVSEYVNF